MPSMNQSKFMSAYTYALSSDFAFPDGTPASWAPNQPSHWGNETKRIQLEGSVPAPAIALSADETLLAVALGKVVLIYDTRSCELLDTLKGHADDVHQLVFLPARAGGVGNHELVSCSSKARGGEDVTAMWELNTEGRDLLAAKHKKVDVDTVAKNAAERVCGELQSGYGWNRYENVVKGIEEGFTNTIADAVAAYGLQGRNLLDGSLGSFGSSPITADGKKLLLKANNGTTQHGMRETEKLPCIVVWDIETRSVQHKLFGHTDAIMYMSGSPDSKLVASVAWDGTARIWRIDTGECLRVLGPFGGQMWTGSFSPDSRYLAINQGSPKTIFYVFDITTGAEISRYEGFKSWSRSMDWSPDGRLIACGGPALRVWDPLTGEEKENLKWEHSFEESMMKTFMTIWHVKLVDGGRKLAFQTAEGAVEVYDLQENKKWRFARSEEQKLDKMVHGNTVLWMRDGKAFISADADMVIRFWHLE